MVGIGGGVTRPGSAGSGSIVGIGGGVGSSFGSVETEDAGVVLTDDTDIVYVRVLNRTT